MYQHLSSMVNPDEDKKDFRMYVTKTVVEEVEDEDTEISLEDAKEISKRAALGDTVTIDIKTKNFGRIAAQTAKQVIIQGIREAERGMVIEEFQSKEHEILSAVVSRIDPRNGNVVLEMGGKTDKNEAVLLTARRFKFFQKLCIRRKTPVNNSFRRWFCENK